MTQNINISSKLGGHYSRNTTNKVLMDRLLQQNIWHELNTSGNTGQIISELYIQGMILVLQ